MNGMGCQGERATEGRTVPGGCRTRDTHSRTRALTLSSMISQSSGDRGSTCTAEQSTALALHSRADTTAPAVGRDAER